MKKRRIRLGLLLLPVFLITGCLFRPPDELYRRPEKSPGYDQLTAAIQSVRAQLELDFSTTCEDAVIVSGDNTATIQLQDLDGDDYRESAMVFLRAPGVDKSLKIFIFTEDGDKGEYSVTGLVEGDGASIYSIDYADLNGTGYKELVVSWQTSTGVYQLGAYTLDELKPEMPPEGSLAQTAKPSWDQLRATELLLTGCSVANSSTSIYSRGYILLDIDQDTRKEIAVARLNSSGVGSEVEVFGWRDGAFVSLDRTGLSEGASSLSRMRANYLSGTFSVPALYVVCILSDGTRAIDVLSYQNVEGSPERQLVNLSLDERTGVSRNLLPANMDISMSYINDDMVLELPDPKPLPTYGDQNWGSNFWLIDWGQYTESGEYRTVMTTYHNSADGWYLEIPEDWKGQITISRNDTLSGQRQVDFSLWMGNDSPPEVFLSIFQLTGSNRNIRAASGGRFILREEGETIYAAKFYDIGWNCGLNETTLPDAFRLIQTSWYN